MTTMMTAATRAACPAALAALLLLTGPLAATGQDVQRIDETRTLSATGTVEVETLHHGVQIERWDRAEVAVTGAYDADWEEFITEGDEQRLGLRIRPIRDRRGSWSPRRAEELRVRIPEGARVQVTTVSGALRTTGGQGEVDLESMSGAIEMDGSPSRARLTSVSGAVTVRGRATDLRVQNVSGAIRIEAEAPRVEVRTVSGSIQLRGQTAVSSAQMHSTSGRIDFEGALAHGAVLEAQSHSGTVTLTLSGDLDGDYRLSSFSGRLQADLPGAPTQGAERHRFSGQEQLTFTLGTGAGRIEARSFSGNIQLRSGS